MRSASNSTSPRPFPASDPRASRCSTTRGSTLGDDASASAGSEEAALQTSLQSALDIAVGAGATIVRARVSYDPRSRETHEVVRKPIGSRAVAETTTDEHYVSASKKYGKTIGSLDRGSDVEDFKTEIPAGRLERLSVGVLVDQNRRLDLAKIRSLATGTLGLVSARGDTLSIEEMPFAPSAPAALLPAWALALGSLGALIPSLAFACAFVFGMRFCANPLGAVLERATERLSLARATRAVSSAYAPAHVRGALRGEPPHTPRPSSARYRQRRRRPCSRCIRPKSEPRSCDGWPARQRPRCPITKPCCAVDDRFVSLASLVAIVNASEPTATDATVRASKPPLPVRERPMLDIARADIAQDLALMRLAALEAFERAIADLLSRLAHDVLCRELAIAPVDVCALAARALATFAELEPVALVVAPCDADVFETPLAVRCDASLDAGDLVIEVGDGALESRFALRVRACVADSASGAVW